MAIDRNHPKYQQLLKVSNPTTVVGKKNTYLGKDIPIFISDNKDKKYMIITPDNKRVHFGSIGYEDFTRHKDESRRENYLKRSGNIKGNWKQDKYSPNLLSRVLLWGADF